MHFINLYFTVPTNAPFAATISTVWALHEMLLDVTWARIHVNMETQTNIKYYTEGSHGNRYLLNTKTDSHVMHLSD
jgi:hypothetical protein